MSNEPVYFVVTDTHQWFYYDEWMWWYAVIAHPVTGEPFLITEMEEVAVPATPDPYREDTRVYHD